MMVENEKQAWRVPEPTLSRLPWYLAYVKLLSAGGEQFVSSTQIAKATNVDASQVAKDLSYLKVVGKTRVGYEIAPLVAELEVFLGFRGGQSGRLVVARHGFAAIWAGDRGGLRRAARVGGDTD